MWIVRTRVDARAKRIYAAAMFSTTAASVVVEPWRGRHHVYATFEVPDRYQWPDVVGYLIVDDMVERVEIPNDGPMAFAADARGHLYTTQEYLSTHSALWLMATGRTGILKCRRAWRLYIVRRSTN
jgi:hypothetical protein